MSQSVTEGTAAADPQPRHRIRVLDTEISYVDVGRGHPIVFLHGNPTYSFLWRNIIPHLSGLGRCLAPDLVGMGHSGRSPTYSYRFVDHVRYLDAWFEALGLTKNLTLVVHDWGSAIGFHRAFRYPDQIRAIAYMEAIVQPMRWDDFGEAGGIFRMPYGDREARLPTLIWPRQIPIEGEPADVAAFVEQYGKWLSKSRIPKLFVAGDPGAILTESASGRVFCRTWANQRELTVKGRHFLQEDSPDQIGEALRDFVTALESRAST
jgi:haloalkane dehalogenase